MQLSKVQAVPDHDIYVFDGFDHAAEHEPDFWYSEQLVAVAVELQPDFSSVAHILPDHLLERARKSQVLAEPLDDSDDFVGSVLQDHGRIERELSYAVLVDVARSVDWLAEGNEVVVDGLVGGALRVHQQVVVRQNQQRQLLVVGLVLYEGLQRPLFACRQLLGVSSLKPHMIKSLMHLAV